MKDFNFAIMGAGKIAEAMARTINMMEGDVKLYAIGSRSPEKAKAFAEKFNIPVAYGSYEELAQDPNVDLIYVASPHSEHYANMGICISNHKPILCEKAFTANTAQAREILEKSRTENLFIQEAMWVRFMPLSFRMQELMKDPRLGEIKAISASLGYPVFDRERVYKPSLAGGSLLDIGIYPLTFARMLTKEMPVSTETKVQMSPLGVDMQSTLVLTYESGIMATLFNSAICPTDRGGYIYGSEGFAHIGDINHMFYIDIHDLDGNLLEHIDRPKTLTGYEFEVASSIKAISEGRLDCPEMPHSETLEIMEQMDGIRAAWNMKYPFE